MDAAAVSGPPLRVLLVGATGVFGRRLAEGLAGEPGIALVLAGRTAISLERLGRDLGGAPETAVIDRGRVTADDLRALAAGLVIDAAGPFQESDTTLIEVAIEARCHYLDLADGRAFVTGVHRFDAAARAAGVVVLSGASSTPALSHAALDRLVAGWRGIDAIRVAIAPGNRAPRGLAVVRAILTYTGQPVRVFREGGWTTAPGWGLTHWRAIPGLGRRLASLCETPDLDLLVERFQPRLAAEFFAGLELPLLHRGLALAGLAVRFRLLSSLAPLARPMRFLAALLEPFGTDRGGMVVEVAGRNAEGHATHARWSLVAAGGVGPYIPTLPALALARRLRDGRDGRAGEAGAGPCVGRLGLDDFAADFARHGIITRIEAHPAPPSPFAVALAARLRSLPAITQRLHQPDPALVLTGTADVEGATTASGRLVARLFGLPPAARDVPLRVAVEVTAAGEERWARVYPGRVMRSVMADPDPATGTLGERFGPFRFRLRLDTDGNGLALVPISGRLMGLSLPTFLKPRVTATEAAEGDRHRFDVAIALPLVGRLVRYRGNLRANAHGGAPQPM